MQQAQDSVNTGEFGSAEGHRQNARLAFENELRLRTQQNAKVSDHADSGRGA